MTDQPWIVQVFEGGRQVSAVRGSGPVVLGRQDEASERLFECKGERLVIAERNEDNVSRRHVRLDIMSDTQVSVENISKKVPVAIEGVGAPLDAGRAATMTLPLTLALGRRVFRIQADSAYADSGVEGLPDRTVLPGSAFSRIVRLPEVAVPGAQEMNLESMIRWFQAAMDVLQSAVSSTDFYRKASQAVVELVDLDSARVLLRQPDGWAPAGEHLAKRAVTRTDWRPSRHVLERVCQEKRTLWQGPTLADDPSALSLIGVQSIVVSPILNRSGDVIGALYGERRQIGMPSSWRVISKIEAMLVELIAGGVAAGLARLTQEQAALTMEQFFSPELAQRLAAQPRMLEGQETEISVLFCDIRGFSKITDKLGPARTHEWLGDVLGVLSDCVLDRQGVLVDYVGDELMAMWGAPQAQPDHAERACRAALAMQDQLPALDTRWRATLGEPMGFGIGIDTGLARVGNTGSRRKFKYGPLGNTVNRASRVQGATKHFKTKILITAETCSKLGPDFKTRRIGKTRVVGMNEPLELCELDPPDMPNIENLKADYESALRAFEERDFRAAAALLGHLVAVYPDDGPSLLLMARTAQCLVDESTAVDLAFRLTGK
jgi:adenylate cyclase